MSEGQKHKVHRAEFKAKVGLEAVRGVKTINEIGQRYGVHPVRVGQWKKQILERAGTLFEGKRGPKQAAHMDEGRLYGEIGWLKMELDWVKKSLDYEHRDEAGLDRGRCAAGSSAPVRPGGGGAGELLHTLEAER